MKKIISLAVCFVMPFVLMGAKTEEDTPPTTSAQAFVLYCPDNNTVICSKNADERMKPASTTKIMTSLRLQTGIVRKYVIMCIAIITISYIWMILTSSFLHCGGTSLCKKPILQKAS